MEINLVPMEAKHLNGVISIENVSFPTPWSINSFAHEVAGNDFAYYIVAVADNSVVGYTGMWVILDEGHITTLAVHPEFRNQKLGARLLNELIFQAKKRGCLRMTLEVRPSNAFALKLYEKTGFISHGLRPGYYSDTGEDAVIMWKELYPIS